MPRCFRRIFLVYVLRALYIIFIGYEMNVPLYKAYGILVGTLATLCRAKYFMVLLNTLTTC